MKSFKRTKQEDQKSNQTESETTSRATDLKSKTSPTLESTASIEPKPKSNKKKIILLTLLALLLFSGVAFAGYKYFKSDSAEVPAPTPAPSSEKEDEPEPELEKARPTSGAFEVDIPIGWVSGTCPDNPDILFLAPTRELLGKCATEYFGPVAVTANNGDLSRIEEYYTADDMYSSVNYSAVTVDGIVGYKVSYNVATEGELGYPPVGTFEYIYNLYDSASDRTFRPSYRQLPSDANYQTQFVQIAGSFNKL